MAIQLNSLRKWLDDPIQPVSASIQIGDCQSYTVAADFPTTIREFWRLLSNKSSLIKLAKHYSVVGWERWQRSASYDTDATSYDTIENAVTAYPSKCLRSLAMTWGLQYSALERLGRPQRQEGLGRHHKRKADTDNGSRRVRAREDQDSDSTAESTSSQDTDDQRSPQDVDDRRSQHSRVISVRVPTRREGQGRYAGIIFIESSEEGRHEVEELSERSYVLGWRVESSTTTERRRHRFRDAGQSPDHTSELLRRHQDRSSTDRSSRGEAMEQ